MAGRTVITEAHVRDVAKSGATTLVVPPGSILTPLALDTARQADLDIVYGDPAEHHPERTRTNSDVVCIGSDHGGFELKKELVPLLKELGVKVVDVGTDTPQPCDYPDFAFAVARMVADGRAGFGIMIDGAGIGSGVVCNKVPGVRAAPAWNEFTAFNARAHNDANVLTLGSRVLGIEVVKRIVQTFLTTEFEGGRHEKRVRKAMDIEERYSR